MELKKLFVILLLSLLFVSQASAEMWVYFSDSGVGYNAEGGEFIGHVQDTIQYPSDPVGPYEPGDRFSSFCIERDEHISYGENYTYNVALNTQAIKGGTNTDSGDPLDPKSAWIFTEWMKTDHGYIGTLSADENIQADAVQYALWTIEGETGFSIPASTSTAVTNLIAAATTANWQDIGDVRVLNVWYFDSNGAKVFCQDMVIMTPVPATILIGLLGLGVGGLKLRKSL